jgi:nitrogen fixation/metabolism regulation signal transduction histidine kinase
LVFDDISEIVSAQRAQAWGEVARRLAHEIKNPLTPIQLSAERLEMKLSGKVPAPAEQAILAKSVKTIVDQVDAMKRLVNEFRDYARLPAAELQPLDLNALDRPMCCICTAKKTRHRPREIRAGRALPSHRRRRAATAPGRAQPAAKRPGRHRCRRGQRASPQSRPFASRHAGASPRGCASAFQTVGTGFPAHILQRAFEPYVTTKARGTGLGWRW